jgi:hypothetical protein
MAHLSTLTALIQKYPALSALTALFTAVFIIYYQLVLGKKKAKVPIYSTHSGWFASWHDSLDYVRDSAGVLRAGYEKVYIYI